MSAKDTISINHPSEGVTSSLRCQQGVKQGCPLNSKLFGLYLDALEGSLDSKECDAPALANMHVWLLFFTDNFFNVRVKGGTATIVRCAFIVLC
jgi:hypothetical protein